MIVTRMGAGKILHFGGTFTRENIKDFLAYTGILEPYAELIQVPEECEIAVRRKGDREYLFVLNFSKNRQEICLQREMTDMDFDENVSGAVALAPYETKVYRLN